MAVDEKWYFTKEQLLQSPSRKSGYDVDKELSCRQQAANFIQDMGQRLQVSQLCINTAIVYMHRFYVFHSLAAFHRNAIAAAALFLAAKVEEQPRKLEHVIKVAHLCLHRENPNLDTKSELYLEQAQDLVFNENVLLQTLGFDVAIDHPHTHVVRCCQLVRASKDLAQTSYFMASNSLHLTTMCLQYKPTVVACFCIHLACKWSNWEIPRSNEGKDWFWYIDKTVTVDLLEQLTAEFLAILDKCPTKLKRKMMSMNQNNTPGFTQQTVTNDSLHFEEPRKLTGSEANKPPEGLFPIQKSNSQLLNENKPGTSTLLSSSSSSTAQLNHVHHQKIDYREYREKKERERIEREKQQQQQQHQRDTHNMSSSNHHHHHHHSKSGTVPGKSSHSNVQSRSTSSSVSHKSYQQLPHGVQQNVHFQCIKDTRDSSAQGFQSSSSTKDSSYLKQHPPLGERDGSKDNTFFHGQFSQSSAGMQHQGYTHKPESNYAGNYPHREGNRGSHGAQNSGNSNLPQTHHSQNQNSVTNNVNLMNNSREGIIGNQRESAIAKDSDSQLQSKDSMSSSIRDIISQSVSQKDVHSMTNERKEHIREKSRINYMHGNSSTSNFRPETIKSGRDQMGLNFHDSMERKLDDFSKLKDKSNKKDEETVIEPGKFEAVKSEKFDETDAEDESSTWSFGMNLSSVGNEKINFPIHVKNEPSAKKNEFSVDTNSDSSFNLSKTQSMLSGKMLDPKYKSHHYHSSNKNSDIPQIKIEKPNAQSSSDFSKKPSDRLHEKHRKLQEIERVQNIVDGSNSLNDISKHHKLGKEGNDKHKMLISNQHGNQRMKEKLSPSKYQKMKTVQRPSNVGYIKSELTHFSLDPKSNNTNEGGDKVEETNQCLSLKPIGADEANKNIGNLGSFQKQKSHEFGAPGNLSSSLPDSNFVKSTKTSSIFSPDSKIPPQNILSSLEKDSKRNISSTHRSQSSSKTPPDSSKKSVPASVLGSTTTTTTSTTGSLFSPPLPKNVPSAPPRHRTSSSGSEPELIPVLIKLEETPGYENIMRERKVALTPTNSLSPNAEKDQKSLGGNEKVETNNAFLFDFDQKTNTRISKANDILPNEVKSEVTTQSIASKSVVNVKFPNEIRSDLGAVIYPKSTPLSKPNQEFSLGESKLSLANSVSTVNLLGIEKMVDTSISPAKQSNQFGSNSVKPNIATIYNSSTSSLNAFGSSALAPSGGDYSDKVISDQRSNVVVSNQDATDVDVLGYTDKKRSDKKKKKEKHKHKEKDKEKLEKKKEKKRHKDKDKERSKEKEKYKDKEKHKDKHMEKEIDVVSSETPIKITIPKDKISGSLKIKISKDCLKKEVVEPSKPNTSGELKIKISKDVFSNISTYKEESKNESRKRDRSPKSSSDLPHSKAMKTTDKKSTTSSLKSNGMEGSSRNSNSHKYSVSENDSCFDISSLYDCPFDFEENGQGIIKTPDYDFEALNASEFPQEINTSPDTKETEDCNKNSHNESELTKNNGCVATGELETNSFSSKERGPCCIDDSCGDISLNIIPKAISPVKDIISPERFIDEKSALKIKTSVKPSPLNENHFDIKREENVGEIICDGPKKDKMISLENCDVLRNYKTILDSHSKRCESETLKRSVSPVSPEETPAETNNNNDDNNNKNNTDEVVTNDDKCTLKGTKNSSEENPNYYNKYFKKDNGSRIRREDKRSVKDKSRFDDRPRYYDNRRYRSDYNERDRRDDRRYYRDYREYNKDAPQYYYERKEERRLDYTDYSASQYFNANKPDSSLTILNYDINANGTPTVYQGCAQTKTAPHFPQICESALPGSSSEINVSYQYGYFNNYLYPHNGGYRFYGNVPFVNVSLIQQQPIPPGTGDSVGQLEPPPLPLEPPPDLPPPPETPPPPK